MNITAEGIKIIKHFESCRLRAYRDAVGVWTIGYGHTGSDVYEGLEITEGKAELLLQNDLDRFERAVERAVHVAMTPNQFDALVSLAYNVGESNVASSTLLKKFNARQTYEASNQFLVWVRAGGKTLPGLVIRRMAERLRFLDKDWRAVL